MLESQESIAMQSVLAILGGMGVQPEFPDLLGFR
jgi:hypothetical protein